MSHPDFILNNHSLKEHNWWKVGGVAEFYAAPQNLDDLKNAWHWGFENKLKIWLISGGSNILVQEGLVRGLTISLHQMKGIEAVEIPEHHTAEKEVLISCWAGTPKAEVAKIFKQNRLAPAVFLTGIPGDVGAGVVMNAGIGENRTPREFCEIVRSVEVLRLDEKTGEFSEVKLNGKDIQWEYRHSKGWQPGIIFRVKLGWPFMPEVNVPDEVRTQISKRVATQPLNLPNCGSVFRNPLGHKSAQLIEGCGLKGYRVGGASVSTKHANFIVNDQGATANDIYQVIEHVRKTVFEKTGVELVTEVAYIGEWPPKHS